MPQRTLLETRELLAEIATALRERTPEHEKFLRDLRWNAQFEQHGVSECRHGMFTVMCAICLGEDTPTVVQPKETIRPRSSRPDGWVDAGHTQYARTW